MTPTPSPGPLKFLRLRNFVDRIIGKEVTLKGGLATSGVVRVGDTVRRPITDRSSFVHGVLTHLEQKQIDCVPRFLGIDERGRAILNFIPGRVLHNTIVFEKVQWLAAAKLLRQLHDATMDCELKGEHEVVCHGDAGPGNFVFRDRLPAALIDFDMAYAGKREEDVGYAAWTWLRIGNDRFAAEEQGIKLVDFVAAYDEKATWDPLELVIQAQQKLIAQLPRAAKWNIVRVWANRSIRWTERNRAGIANGIAKRRKSLDDTRQLNQD